MTSGQIALWAAAFVLPMTAFIVGWRVGILFYQDLVVVVSLGAWIFATFIARGRGPSIPQTPVLGWPLVLFAAAVLSATLRGHYAYGESLIDQPLRLVVYAAIVAGLAGMTLTEELPGFFLGSSIPVWSSSRYSPSTISRPGVPPPDQSQLSTGGTRILGITASMYAAGALFLALLNLRLARHTPARMRMRRSPWFRHSVSSLALGGRCTPQWEWSDSCSS